MSALQEEYPDCHLQLLIGQDSLEQLHTWYCARELVEKFEVIAFPRKSNGKAAEVVLPLEFWVSRLAEKLQKSMIDGDYVEISSTDLRCELAKNAKPYNIINAEVLQYIEKNALYRKK